MIDLLCLAFAGGGNSPPPSITAGGMQRFMITATSFAALSMTSPVPLNRAVPHCVEWA
jgi:hypothetical protein